MSCGGKNSKTKPPTEYVNLQQIPRDARHRECFIAEKDCTLIVADYAGQESVVFANKCKDNDILNFYQTGLGDMHSFVASKIFPELADLSLDKIKSEFRLSLEKLNDDREFIRQSNRGGEFMEEDDQKRVGNIGNYKWISDGIEMPFLDEGEVRNLQISKGTLLPEERDIINEHIVITIDMLEKLPYPKKLRNVPEFAGGHHEKLNGTGYPNGLTDEEMSIQAKIMAISDIYEALTAKDRPYKDGKKLSEALEIMHRMNKNHEIDKDLFEIFIKKGVYKEYADKYLATDQIDKVNETSFLE